MPSEIAGLNILHISETVSRQFLEAWVACVEATKIPKLAAAGHCQGNHACCWAGCPTCFPGCPSAYLFRYCKSGPEIIRFAVMLYICFPLSLRNIEDLLRKRGAEVSHETLR